MKPVPDADTKPYWDGIADGELRLQRCEACGAAVFYPRAVCPHCFGGPLRWFTAAGTGRVYSYTVAHRAFGEFEDQTPFTVALVDLDEGVRMLTRIVGTGPDGAAIGMPVQMTVEQIGDADLPCFCPTQEPQPPQTSQQTREPQETQETQQLQKTQNPQQTQQQSQSNQAQKSQKPQQTQEAPEPQQ
jgi:uncharacterized protein